LHWIHLHGASIGEIGTLLRLQRRLAASMVTEVRFALTYTSGSAERWLESREEPLGFTASRLSRVSIARTRQEIARVGPARSALVVAEKDRRLSLLRAFLPSANVINIEAKPPQSAASRVFERLIARSMRRIRWYAVESLEMARSVERFAGSARIEVTGTLKAPAGAAPARARSARNHVAFISTLLSEVDVVARTVAELKDRPIEPLNVTIVPRYLGTGVAWKDGSRILRALSERIPGCSMATSLAQWRSIRDASSSSVVVLASLGEVMDVLAATDVAVVCGSLAHGRVQRARGHNFLEPMALGVPSIVGPLVRNWQTSVGAFRSEGSLLAAEPDSLAAEIARLIQDDSWYSTVARRIHESSLLRFHQGSDARVANLVLEALAG
jgi:3-deoxy-D-manno-octulosonic-acid transferase